VRNLKIIIFGVTNSAVIVFLILSRGELLLVLNIIQPLDIFGSSFRAGLVFVGGVSRKRKGKAEPE
jgi:hypothetical protein